MPTPIAPIEREALDMIEETGAANEPNWLPAN